MHALIPCAGSGTRLPGDVPKQYRQLAGAAVVAHTVQAFLACQPVSSVHVVVQAGDAQARAVLPAHPRLRIHEAGGATRALTVLQGLRALQTLGAGELDWVLVHDAARCCITPQAILELIEACRHDAVGGLLALPLADTLKQAAADAQAPQTLRVATTLSRDGLWLAQTPQMFALALLRRALREADAAGAAVTDEASAVERLGLQPRLVEASSDNFKVTYAADLALADAVLRARARVRGGDMEQGGEGESAPAAQAQFGAMRIGHGDDVHALVPGRSLRLGGIDIAHSAGLLGHSDADALLHAITDALLGAAGLGDIGQHFPDTDARWRGADSRTLLAEALRAVQAAGWTPVNVDCTVHAQAPRLSPYRDAMRASIAALLRLPPDAVNVKAKTAERLGFVGRGEGISAAAVCLLRRG